MGAKTGLVELRQVFIAKELQVNEKTDLFKRNAELSREQGAAWKRTKKTHSFLIFSQNT